jgi:hypothetical protein
MHGAWFGPRIRSAVKDSRLHGVRRVADDLPPDNRIASLIRRLDDLLSEAARLRDEVTSALRRRAERPFWPDRRRTSIPHHPDRRSR